MKVIRMALTTGALALLTGACGDQGLTAEELEALEQTADATEDSSMGLCGCQPVVDTTYDDRRQSRPPVPLATETSDENDRGEGCTCPGTESTEVANVPASNSSASQPP